MLAIRLRRTGSKKRPFFRVVVTDSANATEGSFVEVLGHYNPRTTPETLDINRERLDYWVTKGARPSDTLEPAGPMAGRLARSLEYPSRRAFLDEHARRTAWVRALYDRVVRP